MALRSSDRLIVAQRMASGAPVQRPAWPYAAVNLLMLLYLILVARTATVQVLKYQGLKVIPIAVVLVCAGFCLLALAPRIRIGLAALLAFAVYAAWGFFVEATPRDDFNNFYIAAANFAADPGIRPPVASKSPTTVVFYGSAMWLLGSSVRTTYFVAAAVWAVQIPLLYAALAGLGLRDATAKTAALLYGFSPTVFFFAALISSESVFNCLIVVSLWFAARYRRRPNLGSAVALGAASGLMFLTRMNGLVFMLALSVYVAASPKDLARRVRLGRMAALAAAFLAAVALNAMVATIQHGELALLPSPWGAYILMSGTNRASDGEWNQPDFELAGFDAASGVTHAEASRNSLRIGVERISADPLGFLVFAFTRKLMRLWGTDVSSVDWPTTESPRRQMLAESGLIRRAHRVTDAFWLALIYSAALGLLWYMASQWRGTASLPESFTWIAVLPMVLLSAMHVFLEVQPRYHIPYVPLLCALSALSLQVARDGISAWSSRLRTGASRSQGSVSG